MSMGQGIFTGVKTIILIAILLSCRTATAEDLPASQQAVPDVDFAAITNGSVEIPDGQSTASVSVTILHVRLRLDLQSR